MALPETVLTLAHLKAGIEANPIPGPPFVWDRRELRAARKVLGLPPLTPKELDSWPFLLNANASTSTG